MRLLRIRGHVQGVGYRAFAQERATRLGLNGWARNRSDGSVEALVAGEASAVERFVAQLRDGPPGGRVIQIEQSEAAADAFAGHQNGFGILPTP
jgi:acylphosphatase